MLSKLLLTLLDKGKHPRAEGSNLKEENFFELLLQGVCVGACVAWCFLLRIPNLKLSKAHVAL